MTDKEEQIFNILKKELKRQGSYCYQDMDSKDVNLYVVDGIINMLELSQAIIKGNETK